VKRRKQELKHAQEVKELYAKKLDKVNDLFMELNAWQLQLVSNVGGASPTCFWCVEIRNS
jgi:hypothetical protein